jgi:hypothetical protein
MLPALPRYGSNHNPLCDLKHNFAVWQQYALNDLDIPIDCDLNACRGHSQNLAPSRIAEKSTFLV